ncbi:MAG TPA: DUF2017 family protein [Candidatus Sulfotelmatobacter sp.]|nr:DUF2017 family protein [Candidatus Sulfotelmatobacter sp.]
MAQIRRRQGRIQLRLDSRERLALLDLVDRLSPQLALRQDRPAYGDTELQKEFDRWVAPDVERELNSDIDIVRESLRSGEDTTALTEGRAFSWVRALNHLRLAAANTLGIDADGWEQEASPQLRDKLEFRALVALGYLQEELVDALSS